jgi:hypothetical protein
MVSPDGKDGSGMDCRASAQCQKMKTRNAPERRRIVVSSLGEILEAFDQTFHGLSLFVDLDGENFRGSKLTETLPHSVHGLEEQFKTTTEFSFVGA